MDAERSSLVVDPEKDHITEGKHKMGRKERAVEKKRKEQAVKGKTKKEKAVEKKTTKGQAVKGKTRKKKADKKKTRNEQAVEKTSKSEDDKSANHSGQDDDSPVVGRKRGDKSTGSTVVLIEDRYFTDICNMHKLKSQVGVRLWPFVTPGDRLYVAIGFVGATLRFRFQLPFVEGYSTLKLGCQTVVDVVKPIFMLQTISKKLSSAADLLSIGACSKLVPLG